MPPNHYHIIHEFFDCYGVSQARSRLTKLILTADTEKTWKGTNPADALFFATKLEELIEAAYSLIGWYDQLPAAIIQTGKQEELWSLTQYKWYCGRHLTFTPWHFFPRHLSQKEFINPYKALEKFTSFQSLQRWKEAVKNFLHYALSTSSINEFDDGTGILLTSLHLHKLIEACHLIDLRTTKKKLPSIKKAKHK